MFSMKFKKTYSNFANRSFKKSKMITVATIPNLKLIVTMESNYMAKFNL